MSRLLALAGSALLALAAPTSAAPIMFEASRSGSSLSLTCGSAGKSCSRLEADLLIRDGNRRVNGALTTGLNFGLIEFEGDKGDKKDKKDKKVFDGNFAITATLAFRILGVPDLFKVIAKGNGSYSVKGDDLKSLTLAWQPIEDLIVEGVGTLAFALSDIGGPSLFASQSNDSDDGNDDDDDLSVLVRATVTDVSVVPLPAGGVLLISAFGLLALSARQRRRALAA